MSTLKSEFKNTKDNTCLGIEETTLEPYFLILYASLLACPFLVQIYFLNIFWDSMPCILYMDRRFGEMLHLCLRTC
jgi:hypothetical protein